MKDPRDWMVQHDYPLFSRTRFRGEPALYTTKFGHDFDTFPGRYRFHAATDRAQGAMGLWFVPFDCHRVDIIDNDWARSQGFGTLVRLLVADADFEIRVAHTWPNQFDPAFLELVKKRRVVPAGTLAGKVGAYGVGTGVHTHTEVVSLGRRSKTLDFALCAKAAVCEDWESEEEIVAKAQARGADVAQVLGYLKQRGYLGGQGGIGKHDASRIDYTDQRFRTWYDSQELFRGL